MKTSLWLAVVLVIGTVLSRWIPHPFNFTPVIGLALFSGARFPTRWWGLAITLSAMLISDWVLGFHSTLWAVYLSLVVLALLGDRVLRNQPRFLRRLGWSTTLGAIFFFLLTNFAVWLHEGLYPMTSEGLMACFVAGIPFFPATLVSAWFYGFGLFGLAEVPAMLFGSEALERR